MRLQWHAGGRHLGPDCLQRVPLPRLSGGLPGLAWELDPENTQGGMKNTSVGNMGGSWTSLLSDLKKNMLYLKEC